MRSLVALFVLLCAAAFPAVAQTPKLPKLHDPDLRLEVFATAPDIEAPTTVAAAPDGSVYIGCDPRDTRLNTDQPECSIIRYSSLGSDKKRTVFATGLYSPAGSQWFGGWLYVIHDPLMSRFRDTDGDGVADVREDLVTNLGLPPYAGLNDHVVSGFVPGMDGFFYISVGDRGIYQARGKDGSTITMQGGGLVRCRPDGTALEIFSTGTRNHLAVLLDAEDNAFTRDNTDDGNGWWTRLTHHIEGGYYGYPYDYQKAPNYGVTQPSPQTLDAMKRNGRNDQLPMTNDQLGKSAAAASAIGHWSLGFGHFPFLPAMADFGGGSPTGGLCYLSDGLPEKYRGKLLFSEWGKGALHVTEVARDGATFRLVKDEPLIQSEKGADFRPMELCVAADGSLLITDWGWGGWKAPKTLGTVWRLSWPDAKPAPRLADESKASVEELLAALGHPDRAQRLRAQLALAGKGDAVLGDLAVPVKDERAPSVQRIHALWALAHPLRGALALQPGGLAEISRGSSEATTPGNVPPGSRPGGAQEGTAAAPNSSAPAGAGADSGGKPRVSPGANIPQPSGLAANPRARPAVFAVLASALQSKTPAIRAQAARALGEINAPALDALVERFGDSTSEVRLAIVTALTRLGPIPGAGLNVAAGLNDPDAWVRFGARRMIREHGEWGLIAVALADSANPLHEAAWLTAARGFDSMWVDPFPYSRDADPATRARAISALGKIAYQPKPYDGHWWGTQPVKSPMPLASVVWAGTPAALGALTVALADADSGVRLAAATAFSQFILTDSPSAEAAVDKKSQSADAVASQTPKTAALPASGVPLTESTVFPTRSGAPPTRSGGAPTASGGPPTGSGAAPTTSTGSPTGSGGAPTASTTAPTASIPAPTASEGELRPSAAAATSSAGFPSSSALRETSLAALRGRLTAETDPAVRRQLIEALGVQKDPAAMPVFKQIALDEKADPDFRDTAIGAVVNIGGDAARETIVQLAGAKVGVAATRKIIEAAGELRVIEAAPALLGRLQDADVGNREAAVKALAKLGSKANARDGLIGALGDADAKVQTAAVEALGSLRDPAALPALIDFAKTKRAKRELIEALAKMPDAQSIPLLLDALRDANSGVRRPALSALKKLRAEAWPQIEANLASGRIPEEFAPEIRAAFESGVIAKWKMVGPFENVWDAVHPPEKDALTYFTIAGKTGTATRAAVADVPVPGKTGTVLRGPIWSNTAEKLLATRYYNAEGKDVGWVDVTGDAEGRVDLEKVFKSSAMVCAYAFAEIDAPEAAEAKLFTSADDEIAVWVNGERVLNVAGAHGYEADKNETPVKLRAGLNQLLVKIGNKGGSWAFHARMPGFDGGKFVKSKEPAPEEKQRAFALAAKPDGAWLNAGDRARGEKLFHDPNAAMGAICATCHAVKGKGGAIGPDLTAIGTNYRRPELIVSILEPAKTIALGFEQVMIETKSGESIVGTLRQETGEAFTLMGADGAPRVIAKADVKTKTDLHTSLMPPGLTLSLKPADFVDLLAYLESLRGQ